VLPANPTNMLPLYESQNEVKGSGVDAARIHTQKGSDSACNGEGTSLFFIPIVYALQMASLECNNAALLAIE
jgi:hypothetical protein